MQKLIFHKGGSYKLNDFAEGDFVTLDFQLSFRIIKLHIIFFDIFCCARNFPGLIGLCQSSFVVKFNKAEMLHASSLA